MTIEKLKNIKELKGLREKVLEANLELPARGLVTNSWGSVSGIDRESNLVVIKPSGISYKKLNLKQDREIY